MVRGSDTAITRILQAVAGGDQQAAEQLLPQVYDQLRRLARARMQHEKPGQTLQPTALVHEAYLRVAGERDPGWNSRNHFFCAAASAMRRILLNQARRKAQLKHGGAHQRQELEDAQPCVEPPRDDLLDVDAALTELEDADPRKRQIIDLRFFAGLTAQETATVIGVSIGTIEREWRFIRVWLQRALGKERST